MAKANVWQWSETPASNSEIDGIDISGATGKVKDGDNAMREMMSQIIEMEGKGSDVASAATLTLGTERYYHVTGSTGPITDIDFTDSVDGRWAWLVFDSTPTITHNGTTLKLPGNANIVAEAGDRGLFVQDGSDNVICLVYARAASVPPSNGTWTPSDQSGAGLSFSSVTARYTKIGPLVIAPFRLTYPSTVNGSQALIGGLPFTAANTGANFATGALFTSLAAPNGIVNGLLVSNSATFALATNGSGGTLTNANVSSGIVSGTVVYLAAS